MAVSGYLQASSDLPVQTCEHGSGAVLGVVAKTLDPHSRQESVSGRPARSSQRVADRPVLAFTR